MVYQINDTELRNQITRTHVDSYIEEEGKIKIEDLNVVNVFPEKNILFQEMPKGVDLPEHSNEMQHLLIKF